MIIKCISFQISPMTSLLEFLFLARGEKGLFHGLSLGINPTKSFPRIALGNTIVATSLDRNSLFCRHFHALPLKIPLKIVFSVVIFHETPPEKRTLRNSFTPGPYLDYFQEHRMWGLLDYFQGVVNLGPTEYFQD